MLKIIKIIFFIFLDGLTKNRQKIKRLSYLPTLNFFGMLGMLAETHVFF